MADMHVSIGASGSDKRSSEYYVAYAGYLSAVRSACARFEKSDSDGGRVALACAGISPPLWTGCSVCGSSALFSSCGVGGRIENGGFACEAQRRLSDEAGKGYVRDTGVSQDTRAFDRSDADVCGHMEASEHSSTGDECKGTRFCPSVESRISASDGGDLSGHVMEPLVGRHNARNRAKRQKKKKAKRSLPVSCDLPGLSDRCETIVSQSSCPSYGQALSEAEREAKESLAKRRAAENAVAEKLAKMKLESLEDEQKCQEYAHLKRQRVIQWTNEATAKSQQSLDKCKSIDPGSSSSQYEIRRQAKELADLKVEFLEYGKLLAERVPDYRRILADRKPITSSSMDRHELEAEFLNDNDSIDLGNSMFDAPFSRTRPFGQLNNDRFL